MALVTIDCNWNMKPGDITAAAVALVTQLRAEWSATKPLVLAEGSDAGAAWINKGIHATQATRRAALRAAYVKSQTKHPPPFFFFLKGRIILK